MRLGKATIYFHSIDDNDNPLEALNSTLDARDWVCYNIFNYESVEIGEWYDSIDLNNEAKCKIEKTYLDYFTEGRKAITLVSLAVANIMATSKYTGINIDQAINMVVIKDEIVGLRLTDEVVAEIKLKVNEILKTWEV